jgi:hypothetical protein
VPKFLCKACGVQYSESIAPPTHCIICEDEQFVPKAGQQWITPEQLAIDRFNAFRKVAPGLFGIWSPSVVEQERGHRVGVVPSI